MQQQSLAESPVALWGGVECTVNRVHHRFFDQIELTGHAERESDLARFRALGISALRYPVLWERVAPHSLTSPDWRWTDRRLGMIRDLGMEPILGLVHHGSGPRYTSLLDPGFPQKLAEYAEQVARRYAWARFFTPINEPLTTARFSALYGHWYPHKTSAIAFARTLINQCRGIVLAMKAIRRHIPLARLVQTEDLGKVFSTRALRYQADFENDRRWVSWDLLCGKLDPDQRMWKFLVESGIGEGELAWFRDNPCPPDLIGVNHYLTSNRFLDEKCERYPAQVRGGNALQEYADVEAVRVAEVPYYGVPELLREVWDRYRLPLAITETHVGCTREEQLRWIREVWLGSRRLRQQGIDVVAVTAWSLLGSYNWNSLVTRDDGHYESGAYCLRGGAPRPTAVARLLHSLARGVVPDLPAFQTDGWWRRPERTLYTTGRYPITESPEPPPPPPRRKPRPLLLLGAEGSFGSALQRVCERRGLQVVAPPSADLDVAQGKILRERLEAVRPWAVINAGDFGQVDQAELERKRCYRDNVVTAINLARECARRSLPFVTFSTDFVFDGQSGTPYCESSQTRPLNYFGECKLMAEREVRQKHPQALIIRTSSLFGPWDEQGFVTRILRRLFRGEVVQVASDTVMSPTYLPQLADTALDLLLDREAGVWHVSNRGSVSWAELAHTAASEARAETHLLREVKMEELGLPARRPKFSALTSQRAVFLPGWEHALESYFRDAGWLKERDRRRQVA